MPQVPKADRDLRIIRGLHAFHSYATEYWTEYILALAEGIETGSTLFLLSVKLAASLRTLSSTPSQDNNSSKNSPVIPDDRLVFLISHPELHSVVMESILSRKHERELNPSNGQGKSSCLD